MEADWEFEVAPDAPVIDAAWSGYINLRSQPERASELPEVVRFPGLAHALVILNSADSPVWTSKCDLWEPEDFDPDELDAPQGAAASALACYIDLLLKTEFAWLTIEGIGDWCRRVSRALRSYPLRQCRADLVIRRAYLGPSQAGLGVTAYVTGCGATADAACAALSAGLHAFAEAVGRVGPSVDDGQKLQ